MTKLTLRFSLEVKFEGLLEEESELGERGHDIARDDLEKGTH
jgi:hypothetical protein